MLQKITDIPLTAYIAMAETTRTLKKDERGLSGVVVAILLILIAVLAIVFIWGFLGGWLGRLWDQIAGQADTITPISPGP